MQFLQFAAAAVISYLGLPAGFFLGSVTTEELPTASKYFPMLQRAIILVIAVVMANYFGYPILIRLLVYAVVIAAALASVDFRFFYPIFGILLFGVAANENFLLFTSLLIFLFGLVSGSQYFAMAVKRKSQTMAAARRLLLQNLAYPGIAMILFLLPIRFG